MTNKELAKQIDDLHKTVLRIKRDGVSMWKIKSVLPKIFDVVDKSFVLMGEVVKNLDKCELKKVVPTKGKGK